jgi:hypothetical protein
MESDDVINPSPFPPLTALSNSARAKKPFFSLDAGCGVKLPKSSEPLSIVPLPFRSNASQAWSDPDLVHEILSLTPPGL